MKSKSRYSIEFAVTSPRTGRVNFWLHHSPATARHWRLRLEVLAQANPGMYFRAVRRTETVLHDQHREQFPPLHRPRQRSKGWRRLKPKFP